MLIVFEGIDGTGKSTQARLLHEALLDHGYPALTSYEPTNGKHGSRLRNSADSQRLSLSEELDFFLKDRQEHVQSLITPSLAAGKIVKRKENSKQGKSNPFFFLFLRPASELL